MGRTTCMIHRAAALARSYSDTFVFNKKVKASNSVSFEAQTKPSFQQASIESQREKWLRLETELKRRDENDWRLYRIIDYQTEKIEELEKQIETVMQLVETLSETLESATYVKPESDAWKSMFI